MTGSYKLPDNSVAKVRLFFYINLLSPTAPDVVLFFSPMSETTILPSFVQLMASLGLDKVPSPSPSPRTHSRSSSTSSSSSSHRRHSRSSSITSQQEAEKHLGPTRRVARYVPYTPAIVRPTFTAHRNATQSYLITKQSSTKRCSQSAIADRDSERQTKVSLFSQKLSLKKN
jgi:hypothetical protein